MTQNQLVDKISIQKLWEHKVDAEKSLVTLSRLKTLLVNQGLDGEDIVTDLNISVTNLEKAVKALQDGAKKLIEIDTKNVKKQVIDDDERPDRWMVIFDDEKIGYLRNSANGWILELGKRGREHYSKYNEFIFSSVEDFKEYFNI